MRSEPRMQVQEAAEAESAGLCCPRCGQEKPHRLPREGFLERRVYALFGYYPWACRGCKDKFYLKRRYRSGRKADTDYRKKN